MEIISTVAVPGGSMLFSAILGMLGVCALIVVVVFWMTFISDEEPYQLTLAIAMTLVLVFVVVVLISNIQETTTYTYARIAPDTPYTEIVENWEYVSHDGDIYKLIRRESNGT